MDKLTFSYYFDEKYFPISVTVMPASGVIGSPGLHAHEFSELAILTEGTITHITENENVKLKKGAFMFIHPGIAHTYARPSKNAVLYNLLYDSSIPIPMLMMGSLPLIQQVYPMKKSEPPPCVISYASRKSLPHILAALELIRSEVKKREQGQHILICSLFMEIIVLLSRSYTAETPNDFDWTLRKAISFLQCHYAEKIESKDLAKVLGISEKTLLRRFQSAFGIGPAEYLAELRIRYAVDLLKKSDWKLDVIAEECGFCDSSHLWKSLKKKLNMTPGQIRQRK